MDNSQKYCPCGSVFGGSDPSTYPTRDKRYNPDDDDTEGTDEDDTEDCRRTKKKHRRGFAPGFPSKGSTGPKR